MNTLRYPVCGARNCRVAVNRWILSFHVVQKAPVHVKRFDCVNALLDLRNSRMHPVRCLVTTKCDVARLHVLIDRLESYRLDFTQYSTRARSLAASPISPLCCVSSCSSTAVYFWIDQPFSPRNDSLESLGRRQTAWRACSRQ